MAKIFEMPPHLADLIAAGEVVERPGSVVKELCENSIDAGATYITVEIKSGGMAFIRVTDNGCGIAEEDAETAFLRHATSKLRDERGLEAIDTLGFRGEALAAIAAVSRIELLTRETGAEAGTRLNIEGGTVRRKHAEGCPDGTTIIVRDLFFNTPARLKFMKNDRAEGANVSSVVLRLALSHPEVSFRYIREGKEEMHTPGDGKLSSCIYNILGRDVAGSLLTAESDDGKINVSGYISAPSGCRGNRAWQFFFLNGRFIKSKLLQAALEQAYKNTLFNGRFPVCVLDIKMSPSAVDVNVHPTKTEVRFLNEKTVFDAVYWATRGALESETKPAELKISAGTAASIKNAEYYSEFESNPGAKIAEPSGRQAMSGSGDAPAERPIDTDVHSLKSKFTGAFSVKPRDDFFKTVSAQKFRTSFSGFETSVPAVKEAHSNPLPLNDETRAIYQTAFNMPNEKIPEVWRDCEDSIEDFHMIGEAMDTYLIVESQGSIFIIDKHAAHERLIFDRLKREKRETASQVLIVPAVCKINADAAEKLLEEWELLSEFGFEVDEFGGAIALRQVPSDIDADEPEALLEELAEKLRVGGRQGLESMRDGIMHTVACKAAIKAGKKSEPGEVRDLVRRVLKGEVKYCPHGRPVYMEITKSQLDRSFKRT